ncbi:MAG: hypothetical protein AAF604_16505 [Acidobacteriota bacterium]
MSDEKNMDTIDELDIESLSDDDLDDVSGGGSFTCSIFKCKIEAEADDADSDN